METIYINAQWPEELRIASLRDGKLYDLEIEIANNNRNKGNIYNAKIVKIESSLNAVFVDYGQSKNGFLPLKEIHKGYLPKDENGKFDMSAIQLGQKILVQVEKDERGEKGAALTTYISLAGTYLVYMPYSSKSSAISKQAEHKERAELKSILDSLDIESGSGIIVRTAGIGKTKEDLSWDYNALKNHWESVLASSHQNAAPCLIFQEANPIIRVLRDNLKVETEKIIVDTQEAYNQIKSFIERIRPNLVDAIEHNTSSLPLFAQYDIDDQIKDIYERHIKLPSGGEIIIDTTEALTAIDINSAKSTKSGDIESTALHTNLEAVTAIAHQLKIRDIGGIVVIDFIDMVDKKNRGTIEEKAKELFI
ncbi:MAG: ribonuclease E/G, partial [Legionellales bacterium]|nr:ribonuclease E/G [Legionellales bacterium]